MQEGLKNGIEKVDMEAAGEAPANKGKKKAARPRQVSTRKQSTQPKAAASSRARRRGWIRWRSWELKVESYFAAILNFYSQLFFAFRNDIY